MEIPVPLNDNSLVSIFVRGRDKAGNVSVVGKVLVEEDSISPTAPEFVINDSVVNATKLKLILSVLATDPSYVDYIFKKVIGYDSYFNCPVIVLNDKDGGIVDIVKYRPEREGTALSQKYLYEKSENKPDANYLYPFQMEMEQNIKNIYPIVNIGIKKLF